MRKMKRRRENTRVSFAVVTYASHTLPPYSLSPSICLNCTAVCLLLFFSHLSERHGYCYDILIFLSPYCFLFSFFFFYFLLLCIKVYVYITVKRESMRCYHCSSFTSLIRKTP
ncbi:hypothetical protein, unlikely [Trypanosoma brucei gambiense DAL972]|uniref:Uncharacterized protein n=1 Tax=Trypanosoma brucei gambiense (strain MHOM/CI/86/DAL972) TaxID=679716 RepID=D0A0F5_TRYB9|nr:hypothetical protein, unlikely [Trypanosoma brucei gambiense DAL972]CBH16713.1 hypothetical protein, unlikely [Trypanosoma brucei gambiense DAL972]|eukprot:XP_011778977.1 hypothetical protein, unlikely [Trypanosoma brucei gambiense DAL972]